MHNAGFPLFASISLMIVMPAAAVSFVEIVKESKRMSCMTSFIKIVGACDYISSQLQSLLGRLYIRSIASIRGLVSILNR